MTIHFSRRLALVAGVVLPILETGRRWHQLGDPRVWPFRLDDWAIGGFLFYAACVSVFSEFATPGQPDPSGLDSFLIIGIKGVMFAIAIAALLVTLRWKPGE